MGNSSTLFRFFAVQPAAFLPSRAKITRRKSACRFTLLEVAVALAVLGFALGLILQLFGGARDRLLRAETRWANQHLLSQATEFYLLAGASTDLPKGAFPPNFNPQCMLIAAEDLPEDAVDAVGGWVLGQYQISVIGLRDEIIGEVRVEKIVQKTDL